jgi:hypothetical protein
MLLNFYIRDIQSCMSDIVKNCFSNQSDEAYKGIRRTNKNNYKITVARIGDSITSMYNDIYKYHNEDWYELTETNGIIKCKNDVANKMITNVLAKYKNTEKVLSIKNVYNKILVYIEKKLTSKLIPTYLECSLINEKFELVKDFLRNSDNHIDLIKYLSIICMVG